MSSPQERFTELLPWIVDRAEAGFRYLRNNPGKFDDAVEDVIGLVWREFTRVSKEGISAEPIMGAIVHRAIQHVRRGESVAGKESLLSVTSPMASTTGRVKRYEIEDESGLFTDKKAKPDDLGGFSVDYSSWRDVLSQREKVVLDDAIAGEEGKATAARLGITPGRVSQIRSGLRESWGSFTR
jgi:hypothetical protein